MRIILLYFLLLSAFSTVAQFSDNFSDGTIDKDPTWAGDVNDFIVNSSGELQLMAPVAGSSFLYIGTAWPDSFQLSFNTRQAFAPSGSNLGKIYLMLDKQDLATANGYYLQFGENGSEDAVRMYQLKNGITTLLASGTSGKIANDPVNVDIRLVYRNEGYWTIEAGYENSGIYSDQIILFDDSFKPNQGLFFGIEALYTSTRTDKFFYDNFILKEYKPDKDGPEIVSAGILDERTILVRFNEQLNASDAENVNNYEIDKGIGHPILASLDFQNKREVILDLASPLEAKFVYQLTIASVKDALLNVMPSPINFPLQYAAYPEVGDLKISEILFDPYPSGEDFVEFYNDSDKLLDLKNLIISNADRVESKTIVNKLLLPAHTYIAFTEDVEALISTYKPKETTTIFFQDIPAFNNDQGNISIKYNNTLLDSFDYNAGMHQSLLDDTEGVSLERVDMKSETNLAANWQSAAASVNFATPGYKNSNAIGTPEESGEFVLINKTFSPNGDGDKDIMIMQYTLDQPGYLANIKIYDESGYFVKSIADNQLLGTNGLITWDGTNENGQRERLGIYIIVGELYNANFATKSFKKVCVLADFID